MMSGAFSCFEGREFTCLNPEFTPTVAEVREHFDRAVQVNYLV
jgi:hypothetical protein